MRPDLKIPPILLEGDETKPSPASGPGRKFAVGRNFEATTPKVPELPAAYETGRLILLARDPHGLYAHWDSDPAQSADQEHFSIRIFYDEIGGRLASEVALPPGVRSCFIPVKHAGGKYVAQIASFAPGGQWHALATSAAVTTPPEMVAAAEPPRFVSLGFDTAAAQKTEPPGLGPHRTEPPLPASQELAAGKTMSALRKLPAAPAPVPMWRPAAEPANAPGPAPESTPALESVLAQAGGWTELPPNPTENEPPLEWIGLLQAAGLSSLQLPRLAPSEEVSSLGVPGVEQGQQRGFWFNLNAEIIIYGATEPDARVTLAGQIVQLRPDGSFSFRCALPDGLHEVHLEASSTRGDRRQATLFVTRATLYGV